MPQRMAYDIICSSFLLKLVNRNETVGDGEYSDVRVDHMAATLNKDLKCKHQDAVRCLHAYGRKQQLMMFLTGPADAGKSTAVKAAEQLCMHFCRHAHIPWMESTYLYTAYTGSVAALFNDVTICKKAGIKTKKY